MIVTALQNETLDELVWRTIRGGVAVTQQTMLLNPNLAGIIFLDAGQEVTLPDIDQKQTDTYQIINLWD